MKVILKENVTSMGKIGDVVKVADGYARNYLIPKGFAAEATTRNLRTFEQEKKSILERAEMEMEQAQARAAQFTDLTVTIARRVSEEEKIYGSVTLKDIEKALEEKGIAVEKKQIQLVEPIKTLGEVRLKVKLYAGVEAEFTVAVVPETAT